MAVSEKTLTTRFAEKIFQAKPFENKAAMTAAKNGIIDYLSSSFAGRLHP